MKLSRLLLVLISATVFTLSSHASTESHRAAIERLLKVMRMEQQYEAGMLAGFDAGLGMTAEGLSALPDEQRSKTTNAVAKVKTRMKEVMGWNAVKGDMADIYMKKFSEEEAGAVSKMMDTPTGRMMVSKQLEIIPEAMAFGQKKAREVMPEIIKMFTDEMK